MARSFNGTSDLIKATGGNVYAGDRTAYSCAIWVKGAGQQDKVFYTEALNNSSGNLGLHTQNVTAGTKCRVVLSPFGGGVSLLDTTSTGVILDSTWHHVCFTMSAAGVWVLYIDGSQDSTGGPISTANTGTASWVAIGCNSRTSNAQFYAGQLQEAANWTRVLSATEALALANGLSAPHLEPAHYWPLWGVDSPEPDIGNG